MGAATYIDLLRPVLHELVKPFKVRMEPLAPGIIRLNHQSLLADIPVRRDTPRRRQKNMSVTEPTLHPLLKHLYDVHLACAPEDCNRRLSRLCNVEQVIQQRLSGVVREHVELVDDEDDGLRCHALFYARDLGGVGEEREKGGQRVRVVLSQGHR